MATNWKWKKELKTKALTDKCSQACADEINLRLVIGVVFHNIRQLFTGLTIIISMNCIFDGRDQSLWNADR